MEMFRDSDIKQVQTGVSTIINPGGSIKKLEQQLKFSDTFNNRVALADAYLSNGDTDKAIDMYKSCLTGTFTDNEYVIYQLILAYSALNDYGQIVPLARKVYQRPQFARSKRILPMQLRWNSPGIRHRRKKSSKDESTIFLF